MKALVYRDRGIELTEKPDPVIKKETDAIVRVTLSTVCMSDLHILHGAVPRAKSGVALGHEFVGEVVAVGGRVGKLRPGDRVAANCITFCGECYYCKRGFINNCERGGWELGCRIDGCQAEYVRTPFADMGLSKIPDTVSDRGALFVGDVLSSGYFGAELCAIRPGDSVAVIGAGPVGLCAMLSARLFGASKIIAIDQNPDRLAVAKRRGLADAAVNVRLSDPNAAVRELTGGRGADGVIEAAGARETFELAWRIARPNAVVALVAMYETPQVLPLERMYGKNLTFKTGGVDAVHCERLLGLIEAGRVDTDFLITHEFSLDRVLEAYRVFERKEDGCLKCAITPFSRSTRAEKKTDL